MDSNLQVVLLIVLAVAVLAWIGVVASVALVGMRVRAGDDADAVVGYARLMGRLSRRIALPAAVVAIAAGGWYAADRDLALVDNWWIGTGIGAWIVAFFGSTLLRGSLLDHAVKLAGEAGSGDEDVQWRIRQVDLTSRGELVLLLTAAVVLVLRPA